MDPCGCGGRLLPAAAKCVPNLSLTALAGNPRQDLGSNLDFPTLDKGRTGVRGSCLGCIRRSHSQLVAPIRRGPLSTAIRQVPAD